MKTRFLLLIITLLSTTNLWAQKRGHSEIVGDTKVSQLVEKHIELNERVKTIPGYRIQIASLSGANSKANAFALKDRFLETYPDMTAYLVFDEPNFRVKIGDFITRLDAYIFYQRIKAAYPGTIVKDNVYPIRLNLEDLIPETDEDAEN